MSSRILRVNADSPSPDVLAEAARLVARGGVLLYPTDTLYGLGAAVREPAALARIFAAKRRPRGQPLPVIIGALEQLELLTPELPEERLRLLEALWPAPLTVILPARHDLPPLLLGNGDSIAVRWPVAPLAGALCRLAATPVTATSANRSGAGNPRSFEAAYAQVGEEVDLALDGGPPRDARGSTIIDLRASPVRLLRRGALAATFLRERLGMLLEAPLDGD
ncbi:MAG: threonylcarbamoyl-AMP synthase [Candidatus Tectomicrobia bacterium]|nr:threonylcarbamoyl-AMP synthase [Candidatus Tectomicrobia bacterium]